MTDQGSKTNTGAGPHAPEARPRFDSPRQKEILQVAARLFSEKGFRGTSMDDIARELGILKGSLYYWIDSKEDLLAAVLEESVLGNIEESEAIAALELPAGERLRKLICCHLEQWRKYPHNFNVYLTDWRWLDEKSRLRYASESAHLEGIYKRVIQDGIECGEFAVDPDDVSIAVNSIFGMMNWFPRWYRPERRATHEEIAEVMGRLIIEGVRSREP